ncbi:MAG: DUF2235 domain-containing protein [Burkholderiales bacterium]|nr:DUF2235 domain-containing protein [Burkholderiales bacterium]
MRRSRFAAVAVLLPAAALSIVVLLTIVLAGLSSPPAFAAPPAMCTPAGGAPGAFSGTPSSIGGAIGPGVGGNGIDAFVAQLAGGASGPPPSPCDAARSNPVQARGPAGGDEPASLPAAGADRSAGNPVDVATGNKYQRQVDVVLPHLESSALSPDGLAVAFGLPADDSIVMLLARHYNSRSDFALSLGRGWSHSFDTRLARIVRDGRIELQVVQADGRRLVFRAPAQSSRAAVAGGPREGVVPPVRTYATGNLADGLLDERRTDADAAYTWRWPGGRRLLFDAEGRLAAIVSADLDTIRLRRDETGRLLETIDAAGRAFGFEYAGARLTALRLPDGQRIGYEYDAHGQLAGVRYPDGRTQRYHYDDPRAFHLLTGITDTDGRRSRYEYDDALRVSVSRALGRSEAQALRFAYAAPRKAGQPGLTVVTSGTRTSRFRWIDSGLRHGPALTASDGDGCEECPPMGLHVELDRSGRTTAFGRLRTRYDALGRVAERRMVDEAGRTQWVERLTYADADPLTGPAQIERPSVVPGRTLRVSMHYTPAGRLARIAASGFAPGPNGAEPIEAAMTFQYSTSGAAAGRLVSVAREGGANRGMRSTFVHDGQRRLVLIGNGAQLLHEIKRDAIGRAISERLPDGTTRMRAFDAAWRLASSSIRGVTVHFEYDVAGRPRAVDWSDGERWSITLSTAGVEVASNHGWQQRIPLSADARGAAAASTRYSERRALPVALAHARLGGQTIVDAAGRRTEQVQDDFGRVVEIRSSHTGARRHRYDELGRLASIEYGDGSLDVRRHDSVGRIVLREQIAGDERIETRFAYEGARLVGIDHPEQRSAARHDDQGRLVELVHEREAHVYRQAFEYDSSGRLSVHRLPDGSRLAYDYDAQGRPARLGLMEVGAKGTRWIVDRVDRSEPQIERMQLGNGIRFERRDDASGLPLVMSWERVPGSARAKEGSSRQAVPGAAGAAFARPPFRRFRWHPSGLPVSVSHEFGEDRYAYDRFGRLIARERHAGSVSETLATNRPHGVSEHVEYFAYDPVGDRPVAHRRDGSDWRADVVARDAQGRPLRRGRFELRYGAQQRLVEARDEQTVVRFRYDALGERVVKSGQAGKRGFLYHDHRLAAETDADGRLLRQFLYWDGRVVAILDRRPEAEQAGRLTWIHGDHLGTPVAVTDEAGGVVWQGDWDAYGRLAREWGAFDQPLRLPGQYHDPETGLHDNLLRTYDPDAGRYLEPDPLGLSAGLNPFVYADGNPLVAADPLGLILFAFDGTGNGATRQGRQDISNVRKFFEQYDDPYKWYTAGVGSPDAASGVPGSTRDLLDANSARARVDWMLGTLDHFLDASWAGKTVPIDVVGFSRGAAMARDFVNRISDLIDSNYYSSRGICVDLRFLGLWDTVAQFGPLGRDNSSWKLAIPSAVRATFHAVALNEHRPFFPLESALGGGSWVVERGFIGDHSDIGGGNSEGDLSDVTLAWMVKMAQAMGLPVRDLPQESQRVASPLLHDRNYVGAGDRKVNRRDDSGRIAQQTTQRGASYPGMSWSDTRAYIETYLRRLLDAPGLPSIVGAVDMKAYAAWLKSVYGLEIRL